MDPDDDDDETPDPIAAAETADTAKRSLPGGNATAAPAVDGIRAVRLVCSTTDAHAKMLEFYGALFNREPDERIGGREDFQSSAVWRMVEGPDLIVTHERAPSQETFLDQGPVWICFETENADGVFERATESGLELLNDPIDTAFDTRGFFANDPNGLPVYVGGAWPRIRE